ncbi:hypothetical protein E4191_07710 [Paracoccus liaowanqingii]|uniref:Uncharacterized protein n=1 Tax=Paracoccus liaowanqingii TaxID=2560053 RepID=A0A4P7HLQ8_9RHOB|nr:hypothetical protein [Paracoccus liaowanqingii]QBX34610.1 hypothetical protein E4191_07710 [Paracoccus liaowanqingii]
MNAHAEIHHDMEGQEDALQLDTLRGDIRDAMLSRIRHMKTSWALCTEAEQAEIANGLELAAKNLVRGVVRQLTAHEFPHAVVTLGEVKIGGSKGIEAKITCQNIELNRNVLGDHVGQMVQVVMIDSEKFMGEREGADIQPDQGDMFGTKPEDEDGDDEGERPGLPKPSDFD